ncbi:MAG: diaminopimelate epimerase [Paracoccaceae bacterium]|nr:diaminopimelate epimerase [Paracoccaceae bacterium]
MENQPKSGLGFMKMHGLGNDFVVIDSRGLSRDDSAVTTPALARALGDRHRGVGFDQLAEIRNGDDCDITLDFWNSDGSRAGACGNATRCVGRYEMDRTGCSTLTLRTERGLLICEDAGAGLTRVNMALPLLGWAEVPLAQAMDTLHLPIEGDPVATGMGNPHCTFFIADAEAVDLTGLGAKFEHHPLFPQRTNVEFVQVLTRDAIRLRIWERGVGVTLASGSCSCAAAVAAARRGLTGRKVAVHVDGGVLDIDWREDGVWMTGPTAHVFDGWLSPAFLAANA